jgi:hypothetical protein
MMRILWTGLIAIGVFFLAFGIPMDFFKDLSARSPTLEAMSQLPAVVNSSLLERAVVRKAKRDRWWMLFVGATILGYRLVRKHQAMFENSVLYADYKAYGDRPLTDAAMIESGFDALPESAAEAS